MWKHAEREHGTQSAASEVAASPGRRTLVEAIQRAGQGEAPADAVHAAAARGVATPASPLPFGRTIQQLFGRHDVSNVQAHTGSEAQASARAMNAGAFAMGDHVVLGDKADLHTVAHEAAHVVQQRAGVHLKGGVGAVGDAYEQHADAVADRVVRGESAEALLDAHAGGGGGGGAVQRRWLGNEEIDGVVYALWQQEKGDEVERDDGWHMLDDGYWVYVGSLPTSSKKSSSRWDKDDDDDSNKKKRKHEKEKDREKDKDREKAPEKPKSRWGTDDESPKRDSSKKKTKPSKPKPKTPELSPKIGYDPSKRLDAGFTLITESEIGARVLSEALETTQRVVFTLDAFQRTQTHLGYVTGRDNDQINVRGTKEHTTPGALAQHLVMELTNLSNKLQFWALDYGAQQGTVSQEEYVMANERLEYEAVRNVYGAWLAAEKESHGSWGPSQYKDPSVLEDWDSWWKYLNTSCKEHLVHYRKSWTWWRTEGRRLPPPPEQTAPLTTTLPETPTLTQPPKETGTDEEPIVVDGSGATNLGFKLVDY